MDIVQLLKDWFRLKLVLWNKENKTVFKQRELWWCSLGVNLGEEIFGKGKKFTRPILIFRFLQHLIKKVIPSLLTGISGKIPNSIFSITN